MSIEGWKYYNHALIPTCAPHEIPNIQALNNPAIWARKTWGGVPLFARWTTDWDCNYETDWWYVIKDTAFDIKSLKAKRRYEITKGNKFFDVRIINPMENINELYRITVAAYSGWPEKYRPTVTIEQIVKMVDAWKDFLVFGAFSRDNDSLEGYAVVEDYEEYTIFSMLRTNPEAEKQGVNAAVINSIITVFNNRFHDGFYICDGARSIRHETAFQDYLEKYFSFRKSYARLEIRYRKGFSFVVKMLYPFRKMINGNSRIGSQVSGVLKMEELVKNNIHRKR